MTEELIKKILDVQKRAFFANFKIVEIRLPSKLFKELPEEFNEQYVESSKFVYAFNLEGIPIVDRNDIDDIQFVIQESNEYKDVIQRYDRDIEHIKMMNDRIQAMNNFGEKNETNN